ncbi:hypothetical protein [Oceanobacillus sp. CAU 1775]
MLRRSLTLIPIMVGTAIIIIGELMLIVPLTLNQPMALTITLAGVFTFVVALIFGKMAKRVYYSFK